MKKSFYLCIFVLLCSGVLNVHAQQAVSPNSVDSSKETVKVRTVTKETVSETVIEKVFPPNKTEWKKFKVCVLDLNTIDIVGQKRFLSEKNQPIVIPAQCSLNDKDRVSVNTTMQGMIRIVDAADNTHTNAANRSAQRDDNIFSRTKALDLFDRSVNSEQRPFIIGAEYLAACLSKYNDVFSCCDSSVLAIPMEELQKAEDFPKNLPLRLAKETGITHLIYGTVSDIRRTQKQFKGYGIETNNIIYQMDVIIRMVDLVTQCSVYGKVYTGTYTENFSPGGNTFTDNVYHKVLTDALEKVAEDFYSVCKPGTSNKITVTPLPYEIKFHVEGNGFVPGTASISNGDVFAGNDGIPLLFSAGEHTFTIACPGFKKQKIITKIGNDGVINVKLAKLDDTQQAPTVQVSPPKAVQEENHSDKTQDLPRPAPETAGPAIINVGGSNIITPFRNDTTVIQTPFIKVRPAEK